MTPDRRAGNGQRKRSGMKPEPSLITRRCSLRQSALAACSTEIGLRFPHLRGRAVAIGEGIREGVRIGGIGVGNQGKPLMLRNSKNVVAVCEVDKERLAAARKGIEDRTGRSCAAYGDYRKLLESKEVDAVIHSRGRR